MKKAISALALTVALATLSFGAAEAADCKVGVAMYTLSAPYFAAQVAAAVDQAKKAGCEVSQSDGQNDMSKQIADVEDMVAKGVNLLILNPRDPEGLVAAADAATKAGVKVIVMDSSINPKAHVITQVRSSNDQNGYLVGQWLAKRMQGKPIKMICSRALRAMRSGKTGGLASSRVSSRDSLSTKARLASSCWARAGAHGPRKKA